MQVSKNPLIYIKELSNTYDIDVIFVSVSSNSLEK